VGADRVAGEHFHEGDGVLRGASIAVVVEEGEGGLALASLGMELIGQ
jgi:hypothetical protein